MHQTFFKRCVVSAYMCQERSNLMSYKNLCPYVQNIKLLPEIATWKTVLHGIFVNYELMIPFEGSRDHFGWGQTDPARPAGGPHCPDSPTEPSRKAGEGRARHHKQDCLLSQVKGDSQLWIDSLSLSSLSLSLSLPRSRYLALSLALSPLKWHHAS